MRQKSSRYVSFLFCLCTTLLSAQSGWRWQYPHPCGSTLEAVEMSSSSDALAVGAFGMILRTIDGGLTWTPTQRITQTALHAVNFSTAMHAYIVGDSGIILHSSDVGIHWERQSSNVLNTLRAIHFINQTTGLVVGSNGTILRTIDGGASWAPVTSGTTQFLYGISFANDHNGVAVGLNGTIISTTDGGVTWTPSASGTTKHLLAAQFNNSNIAFAVGVNATVLRSGDGGVTWSPVAIPPRSNPNQDHYSVKFIGRDTAVVVGSFNTHLLTTDGGTTWVYQDTFVYPNTVSNRIVRGVSFSGAAGISVGDYGEVSLTSNAGISWWREIPSMRRDDRFYSVSFVSQNVGTVVGGTYNFQPINSQRDTSMIFKTTDGGATWVRHAVDTFTHTLIKVSFSDENVGAAVSSRGEIICTADGGTTWVKQHLDSLMLLWSIYSIDAKNIVAVGNDPNTNYSGVVYRTTDGGTTWVLVPLNIPGYLYDVTFTDRNTGYIVGQGGATLKTTDGGATWLPMSIGGGGTLLSVSFADKNNGIIVAGEAIAYRTTNAGLSWMSSTLPAINGTGFGVLYRSVSYVSSPETGDNTILICGDNGTILRSDDKGATWSYQFSGTASHLHGIQGINKMTANVVGYDVSILRTTSGGVVSVDESGLPKLERAKTFALGQNYPNPSSLSTNIPLTGRTKGVLTIVDMLGRVIYRANVQSNNEYVQLDVSTLQDGVYVYSLSDGTNVVSRSMAVVK